MTSCLQDFPASLFLQRGSERAMMMSEQSFDARGSGVIGVGNDGDEGDVQIQGTISDAWINRTTLNGIVDERFKLEANRSISLNSMEDGERMNLSGDLAVLLIETWDSDGVRMLSHTQFEATADLIMERYRVLANTSKLPGTYLGTPFGTIDGDMHESIRSVLDEVKTLGRLPVVTFSAGGIATPADASHMMRMGMDGIFVGSGIFKSDDPPNMADAIVLATAHYDDASKVAEAQAMIEGDPMKGDELETLEVRLDQRGW